MKRTRSEVPAQAGPGLLTRDGAPVPLYGVSIEARVRDSAVLTTVNQRFRNTENVPIEAVYSFPLEEGSAVCGLEIELGGRLLKGIVEEREKAFERYDEAVGKGDSAFLLDQFRPDVFLVSVGRLLPGEEAVVRISTVTRAETRERGLRLRIPTTISPRYIPADMAGSADPAELEAILPPVVLGRVPYGLTLSVDVHAGARIASVTCPSHPVEMSISGEEASVRLAGREAQLDSDFVLEIELAEPSASRWLACRDGDGYAVMVRLKPVLPGEAPRPRDFVFVVDRSGSMGGDSILEAKDALLLCLKSLQAGDRFDVIGFGSRYERIFDGPVDYTDETMEKAIAEISEWDADLGGTEILDPLAKALESAGPDRITNVFLFTDGQVGNEAEVIALASRRRGSARIFCFGIGRGASGTLVKGVARATGGMAEFIYPGERIEPKVMRQMARASSSVVTGARLSWGDLRPTATTPSEIAAFASGDELRFICSVPELVRTTASLVARNGSILAECTVDPGEAALQEDNAVALLLARGLIEDLEAGDAQAGSRQTSRKRRTTESRILEIALQYQLVSSQTSLVAVETRADGSDARQVELRRVPVALTSGWGGMASMPVLAMAMHPAPASAMIVKSECPPSFLRKSIDARRAPAKAGKAGGTRARPEQPGASEPPDPLISLVALQKADGSWALGEKLAGLAGETRARILEAVADTGAKPEVAATLVALFLLWTDHEQRQDEWTLIAGKALGWLSARGIVPSRPARGVAVLGWLAGQSKKG